MDDRGVGPSSRPARIRRPPKPPPGSISWEDAFSPYRSGRGGIDGDGDLQMASEQVEEEDSLGRREFGPETDSEEDDSEDEFRPIEQQGSAEARSRRSQKQSLPASSGEEFGDADDGWSDEDTDTGTSYTNITGKKYASQVPKLYSQRSNRGWRDQWQPPEGHGGLEGLEAWREAGKKHRRRQAEADGAEEVEVEDAAIQSLADAIANVETHVSVPEANRWQTALHAEGDADDEDLDEVAFEQDVRGAMGFKRKKIRSGDGKVRRAPREQALSAEVRSLLTAANVAYINSDLTEAVSKLQEAIRIEPAIRSAWATLAVCFGELNQPERRLQCRILEAHLTSNPLALWVELADESQDLNFKEQAVYCLSRAISSSQEKDRSDVLDVMWERGQLLCEMNDARRAASNFMKMLQYRPQNQEIIRAVVPILFDLQMLDKAAQVLRKCAEWNMRAFPDPRVDPAWLDKDVHPDVHNTYESSEIVTLADLLLRLGRPHEALNVVRRGARWLQGRGAETFWDEVQSDDREFDLERSSSLRQGDLGRRINLAPVHDLEPEFRFRLGVARARMGNVTEARLHFEIWRDSADIYDQMDHFGEMTDEYIRLATSMDEDEGQGTQTIRSELFEAALGTALQLIKVRGEFLQDGEDEALADELLNDYKRVAACYIGLNENGHAASYLEEVVRADVDDLESKLRLAEAYEALGQRKKAVELVGEVVRAKRALQAQEHASDKAPAQSDEALTQSLSFFAEMTQRSTNTSGQGRQTMREQLIQLEAFREAETVSAWEKVKMREKDVFIDRWWHPDVPLAGDPHRRVFGSHESVEDRSRRFTLVGEWLSEMDGLITMFSNTPQLFKKDKSKRFGGMFRQHRKRGDRLDRQARALLSRMGDQMIDEQTIIKAVEQSNFRGVPLYEWVNLYMQYAFVLTKMGDFLGARQLIRRVMSSNVVYSDEERRQSLCLCLASCALYAGRFHTAMAEEALRTLAFTYQFHNEVLRTLLVVGNAGGYFAHLAVGSTNNLKFFLRRSRIHEALVQDAKCSFKFNRRRWVVHEKLFETTYDEAGGKDDDVDEALDVERNEIGEEVDVEDDQDDTKLDNDDMSESEGDEISGDALDSNDDVRKSQKKQATQISTAQRLWAEIRQVAGIDPAKHKPPTKYSPANDMFYAGLLLMSSNGIPSMGYWLRIFARLQSDALVCLTCAIACIGRASNRQVDNRHQVVMQAFAFLHMYRHIRRRARQHALAQRGQEEGIGQQEDDEGEVHYNFGRGAQHLGLYQLAVPHYRAVLQSGQPKALKAEAMDEDGVSQGGSQASTASSFDCRVEAAFSLHLIYIISGNPTLANAIMERYLRV